MQHLPLILTAVLSYEAAVASATPAISPCGFAIYTSSSLRTHDPSTARRQACKRDRSNPILWSLNGQGATNDDETPNGLSSVNGESSSRPPGRDLKTYQSSLPPVPPGAHRVVLMRHGESEFNNANIFTGWCDVALTPRGVVEAVEAGQVFCSHNLTFRRCYASLLTRSIATAHRALEAAGVAYTPLQYDWRFNERHYGALQGLSKERTAERLGRARVMQWRRSYEARPPLMTEGHPHFDIIETDPRYRHLRETGITKGESLQDCQERVIAAWQDVVRDLQQEAAHKSDDLTDSCTLLVAHANTLRALVMHLDDVSAEDIEAFNVPTAIPFYYHVDLATGRVVSSPEEDEQQQAAGASASAETVGGLRRFRGAYIADERKKRSFLERRRAANDPWLWALHDEEVSPSMLLGTAPEGLAGLEEEATRNTQLFSAQVLDKKDAKDDDDKSPGNAAYQASIMKHIQVPRV